MKIDCDKCKGNKKIDLAGNVCPYKECPRYPETNDTYKTNYMILKEE